MKKIAIATVMLAFLGGAGTPEAFSNPEPREISGSWLLEDLAGRGVIDRSQITLEFGDGPKVSGTAGCNRYFGSMERVASEVINSGPFASTQKICPPALMNQEQAFLRSLEQAKSLRLEGPFLYVDVAEQERPLKFSPLTASPAGLSAVTGTVSYLQRRALPPGTVVTVSLQDVTQQDVPAVSIAEKSMTLGGKQVPIPFSLGYDPLLIKPDQRYTVHATIELDGQVLFTSSSPSPVITDGNPQTVELILEQP